MAMTVLHQLNICVTEYVYIIFCLPQELSLAYFQAACLGGFWWYAKHSIDIPVQLNSHNLGLTSEQTAEVILRASF